MSEISNTEAPENDTKNSTLKTHGKSTLLERLPGIGNVKLILDWLSWRDKITKDSLILPVRVTRIIGWSAWVLFRTLTVLQITWDDQQYYKELWISQAVKTVLYWYEKPWVLWKVGLSYKQDIKDTQQKIIENFTKKKK